MTDAAVSGAETRRRAGGAPRRTSPVTFVEPVGTGSMDLCARELGRRLPVEKLPTDVYRRGSEARNGRLLSASSLRSLVHEATFAHRLARLDTAVHLPHHHLARYGLLANGPYVVTVHDLIRYLDCQGGEPLIHRPNRRDRLLYGLDYRAIARADAVIAISAATRRDVIEHLGVSPGRIHVVPNGLDHERFRPVAGRPFGERYVLYVGSEHPRKNFATLLRAFKRIQGSGVKLVKVGAAGGPEGPFREQTLRVIDELDLYDDVFFAGRVPDDELPAWYSHAECLVLPSLYEGFGNPPLEAMACGCPVVVSDTPALVEVVDGAGLAVPATDDATLGATLGALLGSAELRAELRGRGLGRARAFSWDRVAEQTLEVYETLVT